MWTVQHIPTTPQQHSYSPSSYHEQNVSRHFYLFTGVQVLSLGETAQIHFTGTVTCSLGTNYLLFLFKNTTFKLMTPLWHLHIKALSLTGRSSFQAAIQLLLDGSQVPQIPHVLNWLFPTSLQQFLHFAHK